ncbi:MAG: VOC family protein [Parvibaculum sp.]|uniref:VOC family protein n=1 Tax=Parvibaculum sp. TaxID=2024848 RepID=UPI003C71C1D4
MLTRIDRVQIAVHDAAAASRGWIDILGAEPAGQDRVDGLGAKRHRLRIGTGWIEFLEPDGTGPVAQAVGRRGAHLYAAGAATPELDRLAARLRAKKAAPLAEGGQLHLSEADTGIKGLRLVLSEDAALPVVGDVDFLYEATILSDDTQGVTRQMNELLGLDESNYTEIVSELFGYRGTLTLFEKNKLDRLEVIAPTVEGTTMERYFRRFGQSLYMAFAETSKMSLIEDRARAKGVGFTVDRPEGRAAHLPADQIWLHPGTLGGMMLGLSRPSMAWFWSGHPERVEAVA